MFSRIHRCLSRPTTKMFGCGGNHHRQHQQNNAIITSSMRNTKNSSIKPLSTKSYEDELIKDWQKSSWETYLSSGRGSDRLFRAIDSTRTDSISVEELHIFLDNVDHKGVHPRAFKMLDELAHDHQVTLAEFKSWLILATKFGMEKNSHFEIDYHNHPQTGEVKPSKKQQQQQQQQQQDGDSVTDDDDHGLYHSWNEVSMSQSVRRMQYAVRGRVVMRADELKAKEGRDDILYTNIGNPQAVGQSPISYFRQVLALCDLPPAEGIDHPNVLQLFPADVVQRARDILQSVGPAGTGAYTGSQGILQFRRDVADFISERDGGHPAYEGNIFLTNGASTAIELVLTTLISSDLDGVMIPIPQYPIYSALITKLGGRQVGYDLDESNNWNVSREELERKLSKAQEEGLDVKALAMINPGNPTGTVFSRDDLETICQFCAEHDIVLLADEVYQRNIYDESKPFISAKKVALESVSHHVVEDLQLVSFHSTSKGIIGECGRRGGYMELHNIDPYVQSQLYKLASSGLCSNVSGQIMTSLMVKPPKPEDESYPLFHQQETEIFEGLKERSKALVDGLNQVEGISCTPAEGAMYAFPRVHIPKKAIEYAYSHDMTPDTLYALSLLEETGICVVPASGFGSSSSSKDGEDGRVGFRTTFLPPKEKMLAAIDQFASHHANFCAKYS